MNLSRVGFGASFLLLAGLLSLVFLFATSRFGVDVPKPAKMSYEEVTGSFFLPALKEPFRAPQVRELRLPTIKNATSVWGAIGRDIRGHIWVGVSATSNGMSAHLLEYTPDAGVWHDHGAVTEQLKAAHLYREGEGQIKIHSRIIPANDGWLYFASTDEEGERSEVSAPPRWGSHLWRIHPERHTWQHLLAVPEGLVAVAGVGRYIYSLGYWGHVLYQYDTMTGESKRVVVGSVGGHISRNFVADARGHAYVPRLSAKPGGGASVALIEYDAALKELAATPLEFYLSKASLDMNEGIIGLAYFPDGRILLATQLGYLYLIEPGDTDRATVTAVGWLHPDGEAYTPSLFSFGGSNWVAGLARRQADFEWVVGDLRARFSAAFPLDIKGLKKVLLYGSVSRDNAGRFYVGGWAEQDASHQRPVVLQIDPGQRSKE
jgi:hypothetical protein